MDELDKIVKWVRKNVLPLLVTVVVTNFLGVYAIIILAVLLLILG
nr:MAG TPA: TMEM119 family [Caudoviricetes sp.]